VVEATEIALGKRRISENGGDASRQTQEWFMPSQDALNQFIQRLMDKLPDTTREVSDYNNGSQAGYKVTVSGDYMDGDLASLAAVKGGYRLDNPPANI
jgi:hypothetical protein